MGLKKVESIQKYSGKGKTPDEQDINSKENVEIKEDAKDEKNDVVTIPQINYDELPDGVYDFFGLSEIQHRRTKPNLKENEKLLRFKNNKNKNKKEKVKKNKKQNVSKNIVQEIFEEKKKAVETVVEEKEVETKIELEEEKREEIELKETKQTEEVKEKVKNPELEENIKVKENIENSPELQEELEENDEYEEYYDDEYYEETAISKIVNWFTESKMFSFLSMFLLGVTTQISFLASSRANNLLGLCSITIFAVSILLLVNILDIKNKVTIFIMTLIFAFIPFYNDVLITGEKSIITNIFILSTIIALDLIFSKKNKIVCFVLSATIFAVVYKNYKDCMNIFLAISIIRIFRDALNKKERIMQFLIHCLMVCLILSIAIFI